MYATHRLWRGGDGVFAFDSPHARYDASNDSLPLAAAAAARRAEPTLVHALRVVANFRLEFQKFRLGTADNVVVKLKQELGD